MFPNDDLDFKREPASFDCNRLRIFTTDASKVIKDNHIRGSSGMAKTYDNIVLGDRYTNEYTGRWGVFDLMQRFQLTREQALDVSDHLPVWAEFFPYENAGAEIAAQPESVVQ